MCLLRPHRLPPNRVSCAQARARVSDRLFWFTCAVNQCVCVCMCPLVHVDRALLTAIASSFTISLSGPFVRWRYRLQRLVKALQSRDCKRDSAKRNQYEQHAQHSTAHPARVRLAIAGLRAAAGRERWCATHARSAPPQPPPAATRTNRRWLIKQFCEVRRARDAVCRQQVI